MTRYRVLYSVMLHVDAADEEDAIIIGRNAIDIATESDGVTGVYCDPRFTAVTKEAE